MKRRDDDSEVINVRVEEAIRARRSAMDELRAIRGSSEPPPPRSAVARVAHDVAVARGRPVVLVVDDDRGVCESWKRLLYDDADVWTARTVEQAKNAIQQAPANGFACVVLDHGLPNGDGIDVARYLRASDPDTPIHVVSGLLVLEDDPKRARYLELGGPLTFAAKDGSPAMAEPVREACKSPPRGTPKTGG